MITKTVTFGQNIQKERKIISRLNGVTREKTIKEVPLNGQKKIFSIAFPQYNDFKMILRHDSYIGGKSDSNYYGYLSGIKTDGESTVLIRQSKTNSGFSDIKIGYDSDKNLPRNPSSIEGITVEIQECRQTKEGNSQKKYAKITNPFSRAFLRGDGRLKSTEKATNAFYKIMQNETV